MRLFESITGGQTDCERTPLQTLIREQDQCFIGETSGTSTTMVCGAGKIATHVLVKGLMVIAGMFMISMMNVVVA